MKTINFYLLILCLAILSSCYKAKTAPLNPNNCSGTISYSADIVPIINQSCKTNLGPGTGCHDAWIDDHSKIVLYINNGRWQNSIWSVYTMPKVPNLFDIDSLTADEVQTMKCWVDQGYPEN